MKAIDILNHLKKLKPDLPEDTVDRIIYGDPDIEVKGITVCWMPYIETIEKAKTFGTNVIVAHEPTFFSHRDLDDIQIKNLNQTKNKINLLEKYKITIIRCHDVWDFLPEIGIMDSWAKFIGLTEKIPGERLYRIKKQTALTFAKRVAKRVAMLGQKTVRFYGDPERIIGSVCSWYGWKNVYEMFDCGADLIITYDDNSVIQAWTGAEISHDSGYPIIVVNHGVLEEPGMVSLTRYLSNTFPDITIKHIPQGCTYREIKG